MNTKNNAPLNALRHHVTGAIERGEAVAIAGIPAIEHNHPQDILHHADCPRCKLNFAAPELLEALREIEGQLWLHPDAERGSSKVHYCMHKARAAIAKAEGKS